MNIMTFILTVSMIWIFIFLLILPFKIKVSLENKVGNDPSAPQIHYLKEKFYISILLSVVLAILYWYIFYFKI
jgi:predicted secreted protein